MELFGPRRSIPFGDLPEATTLFGDETSIAAAIALRSIPSQKAAPIFLEVTNTEETEQVLAQLGLTQVNVFQRSADDGHLTGLTNAMRGTRGALVLTGKAQSIQRVRNLLGEGKSRVGKSKAYWSVGGAGLD